MSTETIFGWDQYQERAQATAIFPQWCEFEYMALGLVSEAIEVVTEAVTEEEAAGELGDVFWYLAAFSRWLGIPMRTLPVPDYTNTRHHVMQKELLDAAGLVASLTKKALRDDAGELTEERKARLIVALGRVRGAGEELCWDAGVPLEEVLLANLAKLADRAQRGALGGDGSKR